MSNRQTNHGILGNFFKHFIAALIEGVFFFITLSVMFKLFMKIEPWLCASAMWSISWALGSFIARLFYTINNNVRASWIFHATIISFVFVLLSFTLGVVLSYPDWAELVSYLTFPFGIALYANSKKHS